MNCLRKMKTVLTIAGSDSSGGAGIQADIKTITMNKLYATSVITAVTAQNTVGVQGVFDISPSFITKQLDSVFEDIYPNAIKIGMVSNADNVKAIVKSLKKYEAKNIVVDPVMVSTSGSKLMTLETQRVLRTKLLPMADLITPNIPEAEVLSGIAIKSEEDMESACKIINKKIKTAVLIKGGHLETNTADVFFDGEVLFRYTTQYINNDNTHGTGCTLSAAIACGLAEDLNVKRSILNAKNYLTNTLKAQLNLGKGQGPLMHNYKLCNI